MIDQYVQADRDGNGRVDQAEFTKLWMALKQEGPVSEPSFCFWRQWQSSILDPPQPGPNSGYESKLVANSRGRMTYELSTAALRKDESCSKEEI